MEFIIVTITTIILTLILGIVFQYNIKKIKEISEDKELDEFSKKYPSNKEICKKYLKKLNNSDVKIEENNDNQASLYIAVTNKIIIADINNTYTRIQTIAHECLHSIQDRKILMFNFIYSSSNMYAPYCLTSMSSLLKNNPDLRECCFYILSNDISAAMRDKMELLCRKFNVKLQIIDCNPVIRSIFEGGKT